MRYFNFALTCAYSTVCLTQAQYLDTTHLQTVISSAEDPVRALSCGQFSSYTAIGDSYAAGFGSLVRFKLCDASGKGFGSTCTTEACGQDTGSYAYQFAKAHGLPSFQYLACNGNDTGSVLKSQVNGGSFGTPDLVTVNMGGDDDSFFANTVTACVAKYNAAACKSAMQTAQKIIDDLPSRYDAVFAQIKPQLKANANTKVVAMGYAQLWGNIHTTDCAWPLNLPTPEQKDEMNSLARQMNQHLNDAALKAGFLYGDVDAAFEGQRICDRTGNDSFKSLFQMFAKIGWDTGDEWYQEVTAAHPTLEGQTLMLKVLENTLGC